MKWYFASRTRHKEKLITIRKHMEAVGEVVLSDWVYFEGILPFSENGEKVKNAALQCSESASNADIFVLISDPEGTDMFVEFGIALAAKHTTIYIVGPYAKRSLMQFHPRVKYAISLEEVFDAENISRENFVIPEFY
jgi:hypothetical protein